jgi:hypothetical protein
MNGLDVTIIGMNPKKNTVMPNPAIKKGPHFLFLTILTPINPNIEAKKKYATNYKITNYFTNLTKSDDEFNSSWLAKIEPVTNIDNPQIKRVTEKI